MEGTGRLKALTTLGCLVDFFLAHHTLLRPSQLVQCFSISKEERSHFWISLSCDIPSITPLAFLPVSLETAFHLSGMGCETGRIMGGKEGEGNEGWTYMISSASAYLVTASSHCLSAYAFRASATSRSASFWRVTLSFLSLVSVVGGADSEARAGADEPSAGGRTVSEGTSDLASQYQHLLIRTQRMRSLAWIL